MIKTFIIYAILIFIGYLFFLFKYKKSIHGLVIQYMLFGFSKKSKFCLNLMTIILLILCPFLIVIEIYLLFVSLYYLLFNKR